MHFSMALLMLGAAALISPVAATIVFETEIVHVSVIETVVDWVTSSHPAAIASSAPDVYQVDLSTFRRHRHHTPKQGSPGAATLTPIMPTSSPEIVPIVKVAVSSSSKAETFKTEPSTSMLTSTLASSTTSTTAHSSTSSLDSSLISSSASSKISSLTSSSSAQLTTESASSKSATPVIEKSLTTAISDLGVQPPATFVPDLDTTSPTYKALVLQHHNLHRRNHSASDLTWDNTMAEYAETTAKTCIWGHSLAPGGGGYGQNIAAGFPVGNISAILSNSFYNNELPKYPQFGTDTPDMTNFEEWGHFSQFVWKTTISVGCYTAICSPPGADALACGPDGKSYLSGLSCGNGGIPAIFTVCNYHPPGNWAGEYTNVHAPEDQPHIYVDGDGTQGL